MKSYSILDLDYDLHRNTSEKNAKIIKNRERFEIRDRSDPIEDSILSESFLINENTILNESNESNWWRYGVGYEYSSSTNNIFINSDFQSISLEFEKKWFANTGFYMGLSIDGNENSESYVNSESYSMKGRSYKLGLPLYFSKERNSYFLGLETGLITHTYTSTTGENISLEQVRSGISFGWTGLDSHYQWKATIYDYKQPDNSVKTGVSIGLFIVGGN